MEVIKTIVRTIDKSAKSQPAILPFILVLRFLLDIDYNSSLYELFTAAYSSAATLNSLATFSNESVVSLNI